LEWRPHLWLTGGKGTGKTWIFSNLLRRLLGKASLAIQGKSSESGIRQTLKYDAIPVIFDEIEPTDQNANIRIQEVLGLMRACSADDGGMQVLGSSSGTAQNYRIRSCFAFASISVALDKQSDRSRVTVLGLTMKGNEAERKKNFDNIKRLYMEIVTDDFVQRLQARTISLVPVISRRIIGRGLYLIFG
jgi:putative DNA primase/helicase